jgi:oligopeptide/dipeptide ABC transporter ATP-binding protein
MIAMALACEPELLIADEPTTALDVTVQAQILDLIRGLQAKTGMSVLLITHDLGVVAETCHRAVVMYCGRVAERAEIGALFAHPRHPYTVGLLQSIPRIGTHGQGDLAVIPGMVPDLLQLPPGCRFAGRCSRRTGLALQPSDQGQDFGLRGDIERRRRLVGDQKARLAGKRHRDHHALTHPAGELMRILAHPALGCRNLHLAEHLDRSILRLGLTHLLVDANRFHDLGADREDRVQRGHRLLKDHRAVQR